MSFSSYVSLYSSRKLKVATNDETVTHKMTFSIENNLMMHTQIGYHVYVDKTPNLLRDVYNMFISTTSYTKAIYGKTVEAKFNTYLTYPIKILLLSHFKMFHPTT